MCLWRTNQHNGQPVCCQGKAGIAIAGDHGCAEGTQKDIDHADYNQNRPLSSEKKQLPAIVTVSMKFLIRVYIGECIGNSLLQFFNAARTSC